MLSTWFLPMLRIQLMLQLFRSRQYENISATFVVSKSRIVPLNKSITIPRLELLENFILSNLIRVYNSLRVKKYLLKN